MKLKFLGGVQGVTGSKTLLELNDQLYLIDYGLYQGDAKTREKNWVEFKDASKIAAVFLTHSHIDHLGLLPRLYRDGFRGIVYCTQASLKLAHLLLEDSARIHMEDAEFTNQKKYSRHSPALPLYTLEEVQEVLKLFKAVDWNTPFKVSEGLQITFFWAGHIIGASFIRLECKTDKGLEKCIVFSGDLGHKRNVLLNPPEILCKTDILVLESTYGNRLHPRIPVQDVLGIYLKSILSKGGTAIIPAFSVGRTQDVLYLIKKLILNKTIESIPVYLDSPLSIKANVVYKHCFAKRFIRPEVIEDGDIYPPRFIEIDSSLKSQSLNNLTGAKIIISASGMIDGGRVIHHIKQKISHSENGIILVGYQPEGTKGRLLLDGVKILRLHKEEFAVKASIFHIDALSAHADYLDTVDWLKVSGVKPKLTILNHGEPNASAHFKRILESQLEIKTTVADMDETFYLDNI